MIKFRNPNEFREEDAREPWPLRFDSFAFDARCYNTLLCSIIFDRAQHSLHVDHPSNAPYAPDWKDHWHAGYIIMEKDVFPPPIEVKWTALDGVERYVAIDLEKIFPGREILHNVSREDVHEYWARFDRHSADVFLEVNDRTISVYMRAFVLTNSYTIPGRTDVKSRNDLMLAWTQAY